MSSKDKAHKIQTHKSLTAASLPLSPLAGLMENGFISAVTLTSVVGMHSWGVAAEFDEDGDVVSQPDPLHHM